MDTNDSFSDMLSTLSIFLILPYATLRIYLYHLERFSILSSHFSRMTETSNDIALEIKLAPPHYEFFTFIGGILGALVSGVIGAILAFVVFGVFISKIGVENGAGILTYFIPLFGFLIVCVTLSINRLIARGFLGLTHVGGGESGVKYIMLSGMFVTIATIPYYLALSFVETIPVTLIFALHVLLQVFVTELVTGILGNYRYVLLIVGSSIIGLMISAGVLLIVYNITSETDGNKELYSLIGAIVVAIMGTYTGKYFLEYIYSLLYQMTGTDPLSRVVDDLVEEEQRQVRESQARLTRFSS